MNDVRNAIAQIRGTLPDGIFELQVTRVDAENEPISYVGAQTTDMTLEQLSWYIDDAVAKRLLGLPGIAAVQRVGGVDRTIRVISNPAALQSHGIDRGGGEPAASPKQHERRRRPCRDRRVGTGASNTRQCQYRLCARADNSRPAGRAICQARRSRPGQGQQLGATLAREDERPSGRNIHDPASERLIRK